MTVLAQSRLTDRDGEPCWYLQIAGFAWRFYAREAPDADADYTDVPAIVSVSEAGSTLDAEKGRVTHLPVSVRLRAQGYGAGADAVRALRRLRPEGADRRLRLLTSIAATGTAAVEVETSHASWPSSGVFYVDAEAFAYAAKAGDGTSGNRYRFTGITRHYRAAPAAQTSHMVDHDRAQETWVVSDLVAWRTRPAVLYARLAGGSAWVEWVVGFIDATIAGADDQITIRLVPWDAALDNEIGGDALVCGLARTWRLLTVGIADQISMDQTWDVGQGVQTPVTADSLSTSGDVFGSTAQYDDVFDDGLADGHPRRPKITVSADPGPDPMTPTVGGPFTFDVAPLSEPSADVEAGQLIANEWTSERYTATVDPSALGTEVVKRWPADYIEAINTRWAPGTNKGADGVWCDVQIVEYLQRLSGPAMSCRMNSTMHAGKLQVAWATTLTGRRSLDYPLRLHDPAGAVEWNGNQGWVQWVSWMRQELISRAGLAGDNGRSLLPIPPIADAFYQNQEPVILIDSAPIAIGVTTWWLVTWDELGEERAAFFRGTITGAVVDGTTTLGYRLELENPEAVASFGDWPGFQRARIRPAAVWRNADLRRVVVELLVSVEGASVNGSHDVQPFGLGIPEGAVDADQILSVPIPPALARVDVTIATAKKVTEVLADLLQACGYVLQMHLDPNTGVRQIRLAFVGRASSVESVATLRSDEWSPASLPLATDDRIVNSWSLTLKAASGRDVTDTWTDVASARTHRELRTQTLDLTQVRIDLAAEAASGAAALRSVYGLLSALYGYPRRTVTGSVRQPTLVACDAGDVVTISSDDLVGYDGSEGIDSVPVRITGARHNLEDSTSQLQFVLEVGAGVGWNASLYVEAVVSPTKVRVAANHYTDPTGPTGLTRSDLDFWSVGQTAVMCPLGAWAGTTKTISAINTATREVTFGAAHGLAVGDSIDPPSYDSAPTVQQGLAYLAGADQELGAGGDPAQFYS